MANETSIEWTHFPGYQGKSWNPVTGCQKIAQGCKNCYAETLAKRFWKDRDFTDVRTHADRLDEPLRRRKPTCYFVNSMSDLFHDAVPFKFIAAVYGVMAACPQHLFIILTKRPKRMRKFATGLWSHPEECARHMVNKLPRMFPNPDAAWDAVAGTMRPLPNVIHGYSASTQADLDAGVADLLATPSALRCLSLEPLIGPIDLTAIPPDLSADASRGIGWVIVGCESGPGARPMRQEWAEALLGQCKAEGVAFFMKQMFVNGRKSGDIQAFPEALRIREFPCIPSF